MAATADGPHTVVMESIVTDFARRLLPQLVDAPAVAMAVVFLVLFISGIAGRLALRLATASSSGSTSRILG
jgi:hypothetical protein